MGLAVAAVALWLVLRDLQPEGQPETAAGELTTEMAMEAKSAESPRSASTETEPATDRGAAENGRKMIVVLPFENLGSPEDDYFAAGMTEEITSRLAMVSGMGVISRNSAVRYATTGKACRRSAPSWVSPCSTRNANRFQ